MTFYGVSVKHRIARRGELHSPSVFVGRIQFAPTWDSRKVATTLGRTIAAPAYVNPLAATVATQAELIKKLETENALLKELFALGKKA